MKQKSCSYGISMSIKIEHDKDDEGSRECNGRTGKEERRKRVVRKWMWKTWNASSKQTNQLKGQQRILSGFNNCNCNTGSSHFHMWRKRDHRFVL